MGERQNCSRTKGGIFRLASLLLIIAMFTNFADAGRVSRLLNNKETFDKI